MISSLLKFQSNRHIANVQVSEDTNYKQLYLQCKKNVALFMKQVDKEITSILKKHEDQKKKLYSQIQSLRRQLLSSRNEVANVVRQNSSVKSIASKKCSSEQKERNNTSVSKQTVEECLAKLSGFDMKTIVSEKRTSIQGSLVKQRSERRRSAPKSCHQDKENNFFTSSDLNQIEEPEDILIQPLRLISNVPARREKRQKEKATQKNDKIENIKDVLKNIRGKLSSDKPPFFESSQQKQPTLTVITPQMFNAAKANKN